MAKKEALVLMQECQVCEGKRHILKIYNVTLLNVCVDTGADRLICHLFKNNIPICIATSSSRESFMVKTLHHQELFKKFEHVVMGASDDEVKRGKPAPDIFEIAAGRFEDEPRVENVSLKF
jgi:pseudouridine-5'-monophosphatase